MYSIHWSCWRSIVLQVDWFNSKEIANGCLAQRLSPHRKGSHWTELNKERCINLEDRGLMTDAGHQAFEKAYSYEIVPKGLLWKKNRIPWFSRASYRTENHFYNRKPPFGKSHRYLSNSRKETVFVPVASPPSLQSAHVAATTFAPQWPGKASEKHPNISFSGCVYCCPG